MGRSDSCSLALLQPNHPKSDRLLGPVVVIRNNAAATLKVTQENKPWTTS